MSLRSRVDQMFRDLGWGDLWDGEDMESLAKTRVFTPGNKERLQKAKPGVQRLAVYGGLMVQWIKLTRSRYEAERPAVMGKLGLSEFATLDEARDRILELGRENGFSDAEMVKLEKSTRPRPANVV